MRQTLNNLVDGQASISLEIAVRLAKACSSMPEMWLWLQMA
jgi:addiction module HigA family antidote